MHHRVLVRKPLKTAWLNVAMRPQRFWAKQTQMTCYGPVSDRRFRRKALVSN